MSLNRRSSRALRAAVTTFAIALVVFLAAVEARLVRAGAPPAPVRSDEVQMRGAPPASPGTGSTGERVVRRVIRRGDTLAAVLGQSGLDPEQSGRLVRALAPLYPPRRVRPGDELLLFFARRDETTSPLPRLARAIVRPDPRREIVVRPVAGTAFEAAVRKRPLRAEPRRAGGTIDVSLFAAARDAGVPADVVSDVIREFSYQVDFQRDLRRGDRFDVLWDALVDEGGREVARAPFRWALLTAAGRSLEIFRFEDPAGERSGYYEADGRSARKTLMRTPIDGARLTSGYGLRRHPILGYTRRHTGVDFGAPAGTPVWAAGDGVVVEAGWKGGYGRWVRIRHGGGFETGYAHLSRIAREIRPGARVRQGQVIGRVGATGLANAPHLHYEVFRAGRRVNPRTVELPTAAALAGEALVAFSAQRDAIRDLLPAVGPPAETVARADGRQDTSLHMQ